MIPSIILEGRLMISREIDCCDDYFPVFGNLDNKDELQDDTGLIVGYQALLTL